MPITCSRETVSRSNVFWPTDYASGYTYGDTTKNQSPFLNLTVRREITTSLTFSGNTYFRYIRAIR